MTTSIIGVDVGKYTLDCFATDRSSHTRVTTAKIPAWIAELQGKDVCVILEATGVYSLRLVKQLQAHAIAYLVVNPRSVRRFAQACNILAKNDAIDAEVIARYGCALQLSAKAPIRQYEALRALVTRREQILAMIQMEQGHLESCMDAVMVKNIQEQIAIFAQQEGALLKQIEATLNTIPAAAILSSMPGIGLVSTATLLAYMPELGSLSRAQIAALAGLAPHPRESGTWKGRRSIYGGRSQVRKVLYMAALVAIRHNPVYKQQYQALIQRGKAFKLAITAIMRKMIITLNSMVKNNLLWQA